jgi:hypothetical protein
MEIPTIPSILVAAIMCITGILYLLYYTLYWHGSVVFFASVFLLTIFFAALTAIMIKFGKVTKSTSLRTTDFAIIAVFVAVKVVADYAGMLLPGPLVYIPFSVALFSYFPMGIIAAALLKIVPKPGAVFTYLTGDFIIGAVIGGSVTWAPVYIVSAFALEAYYLASKRGTLSSLLLMGLSFGIFYSAFNSLSWLAVYEYWQPLLITLPTAIVCGIAMAIGASVGYGIGSRAARITL